MEYTIDLDDPSNFYGLLHANLSWTPVDTRGWRELIKTDKTFRPSKELSRVTRGTGWGDPDTGRRDEESNHHVYNPVLTNKK